MKAEVILTKARARLLTEDCPYWGILCMGMDLVEDKTGQYSLGTMATDGKRIYWHRDFVEQLSVPEAEFVLAHEAGIHKGLLHHIRLADMKRYGDVDLSLFNKSADYVGNQILYDANIGKPPKGILLDSQFRDMELEKVYNLLRNAKKTQQDAQKQQKEGVEKEEDIESNTAQGNGPNQQPEGTEKGKPDKPEDKQPIFGDDPGGCGGVIPPTDIDQQEMEQEAKAEVRKALQASEKAGNTPGGLKRIVGELLEPKMDWRSWLNEFAEVYARNDFSWRRPNKRYITQGLYLPEIRSTELGEVVLLIDASGSVSDAQLRELVTEGLGIVEAYAGATLQVIFFDTKATNPIEVMDREQIKSLNFGDLGGDTDYKPAFSKMEESQLSPVCVIVLTDGYCSSFPSFCSFPVLWVINNKHSFKPPFGEVIQMTDV